MTIAEPTTLSRAAEFRHRLQSKIIIADGAMGTVLYSKGIFINRCFDELNLSAPQMVKQVPQEYVRLARKSSRQTPSAPTGFV
jgi:homocysteine S-methyltransferase